MVLTGLVPQACFTAKSIDVGRALFLILDTAAGRCAGVPLLADFNAEAYVGVVQLLSTVLETESMLCRCSALILTPCRHS